MSTEHMDNIENADFTPENDAPVAAAPKPAPPILKMRIDIWTLIFVLAFLAGGFMRYIHLDYMALHHDESLYATYCWKHFKGETYIYDPMQHGPFMFHITPIFMFLFGDSDQTMRMVPATLSMIVLLMIWLMRANNEFGPQSAAIAVILVAFGPITLYFNRFFRHDTFFVFSSVAMPACYVMWQKTRKSSWLYWMVAMFALMFCTKENAFVTTLAFMLFGALYVLQKVWATLFSDVDEDSEDSENGGILEEDRRWFGMAKVFEEHPFVTKWFLYVTLWGFFIIFFAVQHIADVKWLSTKTPQAVTASGKVFFSVMYGFFVVLSVLFAWLSFVARRETEDDPKAEVMGLRWSFFRDGFTFAVSFLIFGGICTFLYTGMFEHIQGFWDGSGKWFIYWYNQHHIARIKGPFLYYVPHLIIYEPLTTFVFLFSVFAVLTRRWVFYVLLVVWGIIGASAEGLYFYGPAGFKAFMEEHVLKMNENLFTIHDLVAAMAIFTFGAYLAWVYLEQNRPFRSFILTWSVLAFLMYSYLQEKVPWLGIHVVMPMHLYVAMNLWDFFKAPLIKPARYIGIALLAVMGLFVVHNAVLLAYYNPDNPIEQMVYVQTDHDMKHVVAEVDRVAQYLGMGYNMPMGIQGDSAWPLSWYLRRYKRIGWFIDGQNKPLMISNWSDKATYEDMLPDYVGRRMQLRSWWIPSTGEWLNTLSGTDWAQFWKYLLYRERWNPSPQTSLERYGSVDIVLWTHRDLYDVNTWEMMSNPQEPPYRDGQNWKMPKRREPEPQAMAQPPREIKNVTANLVQSFGGFGTGPGQFNEPKGLTLDGDGNVWVVDCVNHRIQKLTPSGEQLLSVGKKGEGNGEFNTPTSVVYNGGEVFVTDTWNHRIQVFSASNGAYVRTIGDSGEFWAPKGITFDSTGNFFVIDTGNHAVKYYSRDGQMLSKFGAIGREGQRGLFFEPVGGVLDASGKLYVGDTANKRIQVMSKAGKFLSEWPVAGFTDFFTEPQLAIDKQGRIYFTDFSKNRIGVFDASGNMIAYWTGSAGEKFQGPKGIYIADDGKIYVSDARAHRILVFDAPQL